MDPVHRVHLRGSCSQCTPTRTLFTEYTYEDPVHRVHLRGSCSQSTPTRLLFTEYTYEAPVYRVHLRGSCSPCTHTWIFFTEYKAVKKYSTILHTVFLPDTFSSTWSRVQRGHRHRPCRCPARDAPGPAGRSACPSVAFKNWYRTNCERSHNDKTSQENYRRRLYRNILAQLGKLIDKLYSQMGKVERLRNRVEPFAALFCGLSTLYLLSPDLPTSPASLNHRSRSMSLFGHGRFNSQQRRVNSPLPFSYLGV